MTLINEPKNSLSIVNTLRTQKPSNVVSNNIVAPTLPIDIPGFILNTIVFDTPGSETYEPTAGTVSIKFITTGGGGGGGGVDGQGANTSAAATSGGAGGTCTKTSDIVEASYALVIGAGGAGGLGAGFNSGDNGGDSTITSTNVNNTASGGVGGLGQQASNADDALAGSLGGAASGGDINVTGGVSSPSSRSVGEAMAFSTAGISYWGYGGKTVNTGTGTSGVNPGSGGSGAAVQAINTDFNGGSGAGGIIVIEEYS